MSDRSRSVGVNDVWRERSEGHRYDRRLSTLDGLIAAVQAGDNPAMTAGIDALDRASSEPIGPEPCRRGREQPLRRTRALASLRVASTARLSKDQDANMADAITRMSQAQIAYQAALGAVGNASKLSLLDYIK